MKKTVIGCLTILFLLPTMIGNMVQSQETQDDQDVQEKMEDRQKFMRAKLDHSRKIVEGLSLENFDAIEGAAQSLMLMSNESNWKVVTTAAYIEWSRDFRDACEELKEAAQEKNIEAATLAYFDVTLNCVRCHKRLRPVDHLPSKPIEDKSRDKKRDNDK